MAAKYIAGLCMMLMAGLLSLDPALSAHAQSRNAPQQYQPQTVRGAIVAKIVRKWAGHVQRTYDVSPDTWARGMATTFAKARVADLQSAARQPTFNAMMAAALGKSGADIAPAPNASALNVVAKAAGSRNENLLYTMIAPCRLVDTRVVAKRLAPGEVRTFRSRGSSPEQGGSSSCLHMGDPSALVLNITVVYPDGAGYLTVFPYQGTRPLASSLNYKQGDIVGNEIIAQSIGEYDGFFSLYSLAAADVVIDVAGYFSVPKSEPLDCVEERSAIIDLASGATATAVTPVCPVGYSATGGGCQSANAYTSINGIYFHSFGPNAQGAYECAARNRESSTQRILARVICCRMPVNAQ
jgi:hypothetical protein